MNPLAHLSLVLALGAMVWAPGAYFARLLTQKKWVESPSAPLIMGLGISFDLLFSIAFRFSGYPYWIFVVLHLPFLLPAAKDFQSRHLPLKAWLQHHLWGRWSIENRRDFGAFVLTWCLLPVAAFFYYGLQPIEAYYHDEILRGAMTPFITQGFPLTDFLVYSPERFYYYYLAELFVANLAQATGIWPVEVYFWWFLLFCWSLIWLGFWSLVRLQAPGSKLLAGFTFLLFFTLHGYGGPQSISHFGFRQNSFAIALNFLALFLFCRFCLSGRWFYFFLGILLSGLTIGIKTFSFLPFIPLIPLLGIWGWRTGRIKFLTLGALGAWTLLVVGVTYFGMIYHPGEESAVNFIWEPTHYWAEAYDQRIIEAPNYLYQEVKTQMEGTDWPFWRAFLMPVGFLTGFFLLGIAALPAGRGQARLLDFFWGLVGLISYGMFLVFGWFRLSHSMASVIYLVFFGAIYLKLAIMVWFAGRMQQRRGLGVLLLLIVWGFAMYSHAKVDLQHFYGPKTPYQASPDEVSALTLVRKTPENSYFLHNYYRQSGMLAQAAIAGRRSIVSYRYWDSIFQEEALYDQMMGLADRFYRGEMSRVEMQQFLDQYQIGSVFWLYRINPPLDLTDLGFRRETHTDGLDLWLREQPLPAPPANQD